MQVDYTPDVGNTLAATALQSWPIAALAAGTDLAETVIGLQGSTAGMNIASVQVVPSASLTASDTLFRTITVAKRTAGGSPTTIATATTKTSGSGGTGNWTAFVPVVIPLSTGAFIAAGDVVTLTIAHASTGTAVPASQLEIFVAAT